MDQLFILLSEAMYIIGHIIQAILIFIPAVML